MEQFAIFTLPFPLLPLTNVIGYLLLASIIFSVLASALSIQVVGNWWSILAESLYRTLLLMTVDYIGKKFTLYFPLIFSLFHIILFSNLIGLIPYSSTPTVEIVMTLALASTLLVGLLFLGAITHKTELLAAFIPAGTPLGLIPLMILLELLAYATRTISLGLRLAVNMITGHILAKVCVGFLWAMALAGDSWILFGVAFSLITLFMGLEILIAYLQAYIFTFITCITLKDMAAPDMALIATGLAYLLPLLALTFLLVLPVLALASSLKDMAVVSYPSYHYQYHWCSYLC